MTETHTDTAIDRLYQVRWSRFPGKVIKACGRDHRGAIATARYRAVRDGGRFEVWASERQADGWHRHLFCAFGEA